MDLSQQELPLTAYFSRGSREVGSRTVPHRKEKPSLDSQSVARPSKRRKSYVSGSAASPLSDTAGRFKAQLPTPTTSTRKRTRGGRLNESHDEVQPTGVTAEQNVIILSERTLTQLEFGPPPLKSLQSSCKGTEDVISDLSSVPLAAPSTDQRKTVKPINVGFHPGPRHLNHVDTGIATPGTLRRKISEPVHGIDQESPLARSGCRSHTKTSRLPDQDPFHAHQKTSTFVPQDSASALSKQYSVQSEVLDKQPSDDHVMLTISVPSSQSQYLLHIDATPKRQPCRQRVEHVLSSQTQEEAELTFSTSYKPVTVASLSEGASPGRYTLRACARSPCHSRGVRKSQRIHTLGSTSIKLPFNSPAGPSSVTKNTSDKLSSKSFNPSRCKGLALRHSPSRNSKLLRGSAENIAPEHIEDSLTESESDSGMLQVRMKDKSSTLGLPSREMDQVLRHSPAPRDAYSPTRRSGQGNLPCVEDGSATEAESDTEILRCVVEIGKKRRYEHRLEALRGDTPPPLVISPLVSPTKSRIAPVASIVGFTQFPMQEGSGPTVFESSTCTMEEPRTQSESLPSVVRDFIRMFAEDESYPADFPESLRI